MKLSKKTLMSVLFSALLAGGGISWAGMDHDDHHHGKPEAETAEGVGEIREIHMDDGKITLHHEPMEELNWPAMTMDFVLDDAGLVEGLGAGDEVRFLMEHGRGEFRILELEPR